MRALVASLPAAALAGALSAATALAAPAPVDSVAHRAKPFSVMLRSAVVPGWGQFYNRKFVKGVIVIAGEGFIAYKALDEFHQEQDAANRAAEFAGTDDAAYEEAVADRSVHENQKITWIWWGVAAHLLQMTDAYVDAHLANFEADFGPPEGPPETGPGASAESPRFTLALRTRF